MSDNYQDTPPSNQPPYNNPPMGGAPFPPPHYQMPKRRSRWWIVLVVIASVFVMFFLFIAAIITMVTSEFNFEEDKVTVKENSVLYLTLDGGISEYTRDNPFAEIFGGSNSTSLLDIKTAIERAAKDDNIKGIYFKPSVTANIGLSKTVEIVDALTKFKESGKFIYTYMEYGNEKNYLLALPSDSIFMPREGMLEMNGFGITGYFLKNTMAKIGVQFHTIAFEDFKSAGDQFSRTSFSDSSKYQLRVLLASMNNLLVDRTALHRKISKENVLSVINRGVYMTDSLIAEKFIDAIMTETQVKEFMKKRVGIEETKSSDKKSKEKEEDEDSEGKDGEEDYDDDDSMKLTLISAGKYLKGSKADDSEVEKDKSIAIIYGVGAISSGKSDDSFNDELEIKSDSFVKYLKQAREDESIDAILIRIDSPGGSAMASDIIWEEIMKTRKVKPVYASMSDVAASGGYYIAMACDTIVAHPNTITGSIGVVMSIPNVSGLMSKLEVGLDTISTTPAAQFLNGAYPYTTKDMNSLHNMAETVYYRFVSRAAESRNMTFDQLRSLAKGRVWTGTDAKEKGLVDVLGGFDVALGLVKERIGVDKSKKVKVKIFPKSSDSFEEAIMKIFKQGGEDDEEVNNSLAKALSNVKISMNTEFGLIWNNLPENVKAQMKYVLKLGNISNKEKAMYAMPELIQPE